MTLRAEPGTYKSENQLVVSADGCSMTGTFLDTEGHRGEATYRWQRPQDRSMAAEAPTQAPMQAPPQAPTRRPPANATQGGAPVAADVPEAAKTYINVSTGFCLDSNAEACRLRAGLQRRQLPELEARRHDPAQRFHRPVSGQQRRGQGLHPALQRRQLSKLGDPWPAPGQRLHRQVPGQQCRSVPSTPWAATAATTRTGSDGRETVALSRRDRAWTGNVRALAGPAARSGRARAHRAVGRRRTRAGVAAREPVEAKIIPACGHAAERNVVCPIRSIQDTSPSRS